MNNAKWDLSDRLYGLLATCLGIITLCVVFISWNASEKRSQADQISVSADARVSIQPDIAYVDLGVRTDDVSSADAISKNMKTMDAVVAAIKKRGVDEKSIQTQNFTVYPRYEWKDNQYVETGYEAMQNVQITLQDFALISQVISDASTAGANQVNSVTFALKEYEAKLAEARVTAIKAAYEKAQSIAKTSGTKLENLITYSESTSGNNVYPYDYGKGGMGGGEGADTPTSIQAGEEEVTLTVYVSYHIK